MQSNTNILSAIGLKMHWGASDEFGKYFDWVIHSKGVIKNVENPYTIYIKTDYLPRFVDEIMPKLTSEFILISNCSDYSPYVNFKREYDIIVQNPYLKLWYARNNLGVHPKVRSLPGGLDSMRDDLVKNLLSKRNGVVKQESNKVLCLWRGRNYNDCGKEFITRDAVKEWIKGYPDVFDWVQTSMDTNAFHDLMANYKFVLCPVGNGVDPCPKAFEAFILKTIPIFIRTINTKDVYQGWPAIMVDDFAEILEEGFLDKKYAELAPQLSNDDIMNKLTCEYWADKIKKGL